MFGKKKSAAATRRTLATFEKVRVPVGDLKVGMYVCELDRPWLESPFLLQGFLLSSVEDIEAVRRVCKYVYVEIRGQTAVEIGLKAGRPRLSREASAPAPKAPAKSAVFREEFGTAVQVHERTSRLVKTLADEIRLGNSPDLQVAKAAASECVASILRNPDALLWLTQIKDQDEYTAIHSLNVCFYAAALGRSLGLPVKEIENLALCGMLHDLGKIRVPLDVLNKPGRLAPWEQALMRAHAREGRDILMSARNVYAGCVDVAHSHHERLDGSGYPRRLSGSQITPYSKMVAIVDAYDAITSDRYYQSGKTHLEAIDILNQSRDSHFDAALVHRFIECIGIFPPGCVVQMSNGEVGVVVETDPAHRIKPKVLLVLDERKLPRPVRMVDLSKLDLDASGRPYRIRTVLRSDAFGIDLRNYREEDTWCQADVGG